MRSGDSSPTVVLRSRRLCVPENRLVGRGVDQCKVSELLERFRLVTVVGRAGVGKTRLAAKVAGVAEGDRWPDGIWFIDLFGVRGGDAVCRVVTSTLGAPDAGDRTAAQSMACAIGTRRLLLVLDHCEDVPADLIDEVLAVCPGVRILATSRNALDVVGEAVWKLQPLPLHQGLPAGHEDRDDAFALFVERARAAHPGYRPDVSTATLIADVCRQLECVPLAIELVAARVHRSDLRHLLERLDSARRAGSPRHDRDELLEVTVTWAHDLLTRPEQALLRRLSVFSGGFTLGAAEAVCAGGELAADEVLDRLATLVATSLVVASTGGPEARYYLAEPVLRVAYQRLVDAGEDEGVAERHAWWCTELVEQAEPLLVGPYQREWSTRIDAELGNLRRALDWSLAEGRLEVAVRCTAALPLYWGVRGAFGEGWLWAQRLVVALQGAPARPPAQQAWALWGAGYLASGLGDAAARPLLEKALAVGRAIHDDRVCARALLVLGSATRFDDPPAASAMLEESTVLARHAGDQWCLAQSLITSAFAQTDCGHPDGARPFLDQAVATARVAGDWHTLSVALVESARLAHRRGDTWLAETLLSEARATADNGGHDREAAFVLVCHGAVDAGSGDYALAESRLHEGLGLARRVGSIAGMVDALCQLGRLALVQDDQGRARECFLEARGMAELAGLDVSASLCGLSQLAAARGEWTQAQQLAEAACVATAGGRSSDMARALVMKGNAARSLGDHANAVAAFGEALHIYEMTEELRGLVDSIEAVGGVAAASGQHVHAARLLGAAATARAAHGFARFPPDVPYVDDDLALIGDRLAVEDFAAAWYEGARMPLPDAVAKARDGRSGSAEPDGEWARLTGAERAVVALVAEGLTNRQIGERLFISRHTVQTHLANVFEKLGIRSRTVLAREATTRQQGLTRAAEVGLVGLRRPARYG